MILSKNVAEIEEIFSFFLKKKVIKMSCTK